MYTSNRIFAMSTFNKNEKNTRFSLEKKMPQNRDLYRMDDSRLDAIFHSKKRSKKQQKITLSVYQWVQKAAEKPYFFVPKSCISTTKIASKSFIYTQWIDFV